MTYKQYKVFSILLVTFLACIFVLYEPLRMSAFFQQNKFLRTMLFYVPALLAISSLCLSIYAYIKKIEPLKKYGRPITVFGIVASFICLLCAMIPLILGIIFSPW